MVGQKKLREAYDRLQAAKGEMNAAQKEFDNLVLPYLPYEYGSRVEKDGDEYIVREIEPFDANGVIKIGVLGSAKFPDGYSASRRFIIEIVDIWGEKWERTS